MKLLLPLFLILTASALASDPETATDTEKPPILTEKIQNTSPDGKYALLISYDRALNELMLPKNPAPEGGIFSETMHALAIVSLPAKKTLRDLTEDVFSGGNHFNGLMLLWSSDSKWCALFFAFPRIGYTSVFHFEGGKFQRAHPPDELNVPTKDNVRNEYIAPVRWVKPGVLELSVERVLRGDAEGDGVIGFTASFHGKGKFKILKKKR
jgi:hypothetical protein